MLIRFKASSIQRASFCKKFGDDRFIIWGENSGKTNKTSPGSDLCNQIRFPKQRKEPLENASHVRNAAARFNQVKGVTEAERRAAWKRIQSAAKRYGVELEKSAKG